MIEIETSQRFVSFQIPSEVNPQLSTSPLPSPPMYVYIHIEISTLQKTAESKALGLDLDRCEAQPYRYLNQISMYSK